MGQFSSYDLRRQLAGRFMTEAARVYDDLRDSDRCGAGLKEEAITSNFLIGLSRHATPALSFRAYSHTEEKLTGADWEWWFGDGPGTPYVGVRVQAKRWRTTVAGGYDFRYPNDSSRPRQVDTLISAARASTPPRAALYCLYSGPRTKSLHSHCCQPVPPPEPALGISVIPALAARAIADRRSGVSADANDYAVPLHCLVLCEPSWVGSMHSAPGAATEPVPDDVPLSWWVNSALTGLQNLIIQDAHVAAADETSVVMNWQQVPDGVQRLVRFEQDEVRAEPDDQLKTYLDDQRLQGLITFSLRASPAPEEPRQG
ncbi:DUF6615 family protein [Spongisporangium articulatum]|uniref:DUF6615 family protein n=1 Tax=Spongisporangium articulatum TaxID=3362603 RepID=A0ABW8AVB2_9ACTN